VIELFCHTVGSNLDLCHMATCCKRHFLLFSNVLALRGAKYPKGIGQHQNCTLDRYRKWCFCRVLVGPLWHATNYAVLYVLPYYAVFSAV